MPFLLPPSALLMYSSLQEPTSWSRHVRRQKCVADVDRSKRENPTLHGSVQQLGYDLQDQSMYTVCCQGSIRLLYLLCKAATYGGMFRCRLAQQRARVVTLKECGG